MAKKTQLGKGNLGAKQELDKELAKFFSENNMNKELQQFMTEAPDLIEQLTEEDLKELEVLNQMEKDSDLEKIVKQNQNQETWYSGISSFFDAFTDRSTLSDYWHDKKEDKWYKMNGSITNRFDKENLSEVPFSEVQNLIEEQSKKMSSSGGYKTGRGVSNVIEQAWNDGAWGTVVGLGSLITRGLTGNWDSVNDSQIESLWNRTKHYANNTWDELYDQIDYKINGSDAFAKMISREKERDIRDAKAQKEYEEIQSKGRDAMKDRLDLEKERRGNNKKLFIDKLYDWSGIGDENDFIDQQEKIKQTISARAMELEGRKKKSFTSVEDKISTDTFKYIDNDKNINMDLPMEKPGGQNGTSKSIWDVQKLVIDAEGKPALHEDGTPMYVDKYSWSEKLTNSNWDVLGDSYYLQDDLAKGVGTAIGFVAGGKGTNGLVKTATKTASKSVKYAGQTLNLENKVFNYTNKLINGIKPVSSKIKNIDRTGFSKIVNKVNDKISTAIQTTAQSYLMSNTESEQIGRQVQKKVLESQIDKYANINLQQIAKQLQSDGDFISDSTLFLQVQMTADSKRQKWAEENPEMFNEILLQSQLAKEQSRAINNINFINNLSSAGLFVKGKSFVRNILDNPFSKKSLKRGVWNITKEMAQEGVIEEGIINGFAEKAGEAAGELKFYDISDFAKNDIGGSEFAENVFAGSLLGGMQTSFTKGMSIKGEYQKFKEQKKILNELENIGGLDTKENIKKVIEYSLDKSNNEAIANKMNELLNEGREEEANALADTLLLNKSVKAATSGTTEILNDSFKQLLNNENLTKEDKVEIQSAIDFNNQIANIYDAHIQYDNKSTIIGNRGNKIVLEKYKKDLIESLPDLQEEYDKTKERVARKQLQSENIDYSANDFQSLLETKKENIKLNPNDYKAARELNTANKQIQEIQNKQDEIDDNYEYLISNKGQAEYKSRIKQIRKEKIISSVNKNNIEQVKEDLKQNEQLTPEVNSKINQTVEEKIIKETSEIVKPVIKEKKINEEEIDVSEIATQDINDILPGVKEKAKDFISIEEDSLFSEKDVEIIADDNDALSLQPIDLNEENESHNEIVKKYSKVMKDLNNDMVQESGSNLSPKEMFGLFTSTVGKDIGEKHFNFFKKAFENSGIEIEENYNWDSLYNRYFSKLKGFLLNNDVTIKQAPTTENIERQDVKTTSIIKEETKPVGYNQNNSSIKYLGRKTATAVNKIPFLGVKYDAVFNEIDGSVTYVDDKNGELNTEGISDLNVVLDPDILVPGRQFELEIPQDWRTRIISDWNINPQGLLVQQTKTMEQWMEDKGIKEGSTEWINKVPMDMVIDGNIIGPGVHDVSWWNSRNIADFTQATIDGEKLSPEQAKHHQTQVILEGRKMTSFIRQNVFNGNTSMKITEREEGHTLSNKNGELSTIFEANPNTKISIFSPQGFIVSKGDNGNDYFKGKVVNESSIQDKGHVFMISRIGTKNINGKNIPTYVAHKLHTNHNQENLIKLAKSRQRIYDAVDILNKIGAYQNPTEEQINWATTVKQQIKSMTGISIDNISMNGNQVVKTGAGKLRQLYPMSTSDKSGLMLLPQLENIENQKLPIVHQDGSVTNYKSEAGTGYKAMLMDNLHTQKKFHKIINSEGKTNYILDVQPKITFDLSDKKNDVTKQKVKEETKEKKEKVEEKQTEKKQIDNITEGQRRRVVEYLFHNVLSSIDITKDFTNKDVMSKIENSFNDHLNKLENEHQEEYDYLLKTKDSILGINKYSENVNTVKSEISAFLNQELTQDTEEQINDEGLFKKNNNKASFENDVRTSLSTRLKIFFAGIPKSDEKVVVEQFAGLDSYYGLDEVIGGLQDMLVNIPNTPKAFKNKIENQIEKNPDEFGFLENILNKFNDASLETQKEILYRLNQTKNEMHFVMYSKSKNGNYTLRVYDANSKNPKIKTKLQYQENLKQSSLIKNYGDEYKLDTKKAKELIDQYNSWKGRYDSVPNHQYKEWLSNFGIEVSAKTIQDYKDGLVEGHVKFTGNFLKNGGVFGTLISNLTTALDKQNKDKNTIFKYRPEGTGSKDSFNILLNNNNGFLKTMIDVEVNNTFNLASSMYIGGKTINAFSQPNFTTEQLRKIKESDNALIENLKQSSFSKNSLLLKLLDNKKIKNNLNIGYVSLQSLKQQGQKVYQDSEIVDLSSQDYDLLLQGFFESEGAYFKNQELENKGIQLRESKMTFPTLSDSSQMFIFNTAALNLKKGNFTFNGNNVSINTEVLDVMYDQLVKPDLDRIEAYLKSKSNINIQGLNLGSQLFTIIPSLNSLSIDIDGNKVKLLSKIHTDIKNGNDVNKTIEKYKPVIYDKLQNVIKENVDSKINIVDNKMKGTWIDNGFIDNNANVSFLDFKYLSSRGTTDRIEQVQIAAYDYVINYYINQAQIQMLFAGDIANYIKDKHEGKFATDKNGNVDVTKPLVSVEENENQLEVEQQVYNSIIKDTSVNMSKRLKELISPGNRIAESKGEKYIQIMVDDVEESSDTLDQLVKTWFPSVHSESKNDIKKLKDLEKRIRKDVKNDTPVKVLKQEYKSLKKKLQSKFPEIADYLNITSTDAQEYTTWNEHLHILLNQGRIEKSLYDKVYSKLMSQSKDGINESNRLDNEEKKVIFQPLKPLHSGLYFEDMKDNEGNVTGKLQRFVYVKTSSFPLLPELTQGIQLDSLRKNIEELENKTGKKVRVSYQSGNKVGAVREAISMFELYSNYDNKLENKIMNSSAILDRENFSIQQDKPFKTDKDIKVNKRSEIIRAVQFEKILLGNGINKIVEKIFPNNFDSQLLESLGIEEKKGMLSGKDLYTIYTNLYKKEQAILRNQLYNSLGLNNSGDWVNNIETLEQIKKVLSQRLSNQQDKEILELSYIVPEEKNGRIINNYYTKEQVKKLGLKPTRAEFNIPIWMSPNSRKFESVLNSIVNNKLLNLKLPGFSSPVASQEGFKYKDETELKDKKGIIFTEKYDGTLKATHNSDGTLKYAQVMVASKFRVKENGKDKLIDLTKYTKKLEDGRVVLDTDRIGPDLLQMFSFRIPTSAHQSGALIEVVGFLPHSSGDLMIVPKDHVVQLGEDYDIDTRYVYSQNYRIDNDGNIKKIDSHYIQEKIKSLENSLSDEQELNAQIDEILNMFDSIREDEQIQSIFNQERTKQEQKVQILKDKLNHLLIENQLVDVYKSVFSSTNDDIQKMIGATLSTQFAEDTVEMIDKKLNSQNTSDNFSIFDDRHQKSILKLGASGKLGIGVHSNWVVLNSLFQQMESNPKLINGYDEKTESTIPFSMRIGDFESDGTLGKIKALEPRKKIKGFKPRLLSVINMESQNSSTDNQKLQIMGRRNENKYTINAFALMSNLGFDKDIVNGQEVSLPSLFISQPIIRRYVELKERFDSITSDFQNDVDSIITGELLKEFSQGVDLIQTKSGLKMDFNQMKYVEKSELTGQKLYDSLIKGNNAQQWAVYEKFLEFNKHVQNINQVQKLANIDSNGLGVSFFDTIAKKDALLLNMTSENLNIEGIEDLFGKKTMVLSQETETINSLINDGYIKVESQDEYSVLVKPTTPLNSKLISSVASGYNLWSNVIPFENEFIDEQITNILHIASKNPNTKTGTELKYKVVSDMKDFIYSYSNLGIFDKNSVQYERSKLFIDTDNNQSLASYLNELKKDNHKLFNEPFFKDLDFVLSKNTEPSLIKYSTNDKTNFNKNSVYTTFKILNDSKEILPEFNGDKNYTFEKLAKDLTKYSLLSNQENGAIGFRNYIPLEIFDKYNVTSNLRRHSGIGKHNSHNLLLNGDFKGLMNIIGAYKINNNNTVNINHNIKEERIKEYVDRINTKYGQSSLVYDKQNNVIVINNVNLNKFKSLFTKQFFQHNPGDAKKYNWKNKKEWLNKYNSTNLEELRWFTPKTEMEEYISVRDSKNSKFLLFEKDNNGIYQRINTLGTFGLNEYSPFKSDNVSLVQSNNFKNKKTVSIKPVNIKSENLSETLGVNEGVSTVIDNIVKDNNKFSEVADLIKPFVENVEIEIKDLKGLANGIYVPKNDKSNSVSTSIGNLDRGKIYVSEKLLENGNKSKAQYAIMEEIVHSITVDEIDKYVDTRRSYLDENGDMKIVYKTESVPAHIIKLVSLFKDGSKHILDKYSQDSSLEEAINKINEQKAIWNKDIDSEFYTNENNASNDLKVDTYRTLNLGEFIAGVMLSEKFRSEMDSVTYRKTGNSILSNFAQVITKLLKSISPNAVKNSITENTFDAIMSLLTEKSNENKPVINSKMQKTETDLQAEKLLENNLSNPSNDAKDENSIDLQPVELDDILKIDIC